MWRLKSPRCNVYTHMPEHGVGVPHCVICFFSSTIYSRHQHIYRNYTIVFAFQHLEHEVSILIICTTNTQLQSYITECSLFMTMMETVKSGGTNKVPKHFHPWVPKYVMCTNVENYFNYEITCRLV